MTPRQQLDAFIDRYSPQVAALARELLAAMRTKVPGASELVYDNYNALAIGFAPGDRTSDAVFSIALYPKWVNLFFLEGVRLSDPQRVLKGSGNQVRYIRPTAAADLNHESVAALINQALSLADPPFDPKAKRRIVIKSISERQRPRRPL